jgi:hypothetical protein
MGTGIGALRHICGCNETIIIHGPTKNRTYGTSVTHFLVSETSLAI